MKINLRNFCLAFVAVGALAFSRAALAGEPTAFELVKEGNRHVGDDAKGRVVQIRSEKSIGTLTPNTWFIVYYDPDATAMATEVKFAGGKKISVKRPTRILEPITGAHKELAKDKLKTDSDKALEIAKSEPILKNLTLTASQMWLERRDDQPCWRIRLWAQKLRRPTDTTDIGEIFIATEDGKVMKNDLKIDRVD